ncbi:MAG: DEAD/DEAH box helicase family protein [Flavobacteriales bacterium AspAUS03]
MGLIITTVIKKFKSPVGQIPQAFESSKILVLLDEVHRSHYSSFKVKMQKFFPKCCFIAFTGTPMIRKDKNTSTRFSGIIHIYSIIDSVRDGAVVSLFYEGHHMEMWVNEKPIDDHFDRVTEPLTDYSKETLRKNSSSVVPYCDRWISLKAQLGILSNILTIISMGQLLNESWSHWTNICPFVIVNFSRMLARFQPSCLSPIPIYKKGRTMPLKNLIIQ